MISTPIRLYFDFIDPRCWLYGRTVQQLASEAGRPVHWVPFELNPPPSPMVGIEDPLVRERWAKALDQSAAHEVELLRPAYAPWTRKAHELVEHATEEGVGEQVRSAIFRSHLAEGADIGRIDVLVEIAVQAGLDRTHAKAVLDVDRHEETVAAHSVDAKAAGVEDCPTLVWQGEVLAGFHAASIVRTFLGI